MPAESVRVVVVALALTLAMLPLGCRQPEQTHAMHFEALLQELADAWNDGDATRAASCFTDDAIYSEPPDRQLYRGRPALYEFFGGADGRPGQMQMQWHHVAIDSETGVGFGEFSFTYGTTAHGVAVIRLRDGLISNWREYWYKSDLSWDEFNAANRF